MRNMSKPVKIVYLLKQVYVNRLNTWMPVPKSQQIDAHTEQNEREKKSASRASPVHTQLAMTKIHWADSFVEWWFWCVCFHAKLHLIWAAALLHAFISAVIVAGPRVGPNANERDSATKCAIVFPFRCAFVFLSFRMGFCDAFAFSVFGSHQPSQPRTCYLYKFFAYYNLRSFIFAFHGRCVALQSNDSQCKPFIFDT